MQHVFIKCNRVEASWSFVGAFYFWKIEILVLSTVVVVNVVILLSDWCVHQPRMSPASKRPTPNSATASPWSSQRFPGQPATSWGHSRWAGVSSLRPWWAAPRARRSSSSPTQTTGWASCPSTLGGGASPPSPSRPGQVRKKFLPQESCTHFTLWRQHFKLW